MLLSYQSKTVRHWEYKRIKCGWFWYQLMSNYAPKWKPDDRVNYKQHFGEIFSNGISVADNQSKISRLCCREKKYNIQSVPRIEIFAECLKKYNDMANYLQSIQGQ